MHHTTLAPWRRYSAELIQRRGPIPEEARLLAGEVLRHVEIAPERAERLSQDCLERGERELLIAAAKRAGDRGQFRAWARLLSEVLLARRGS